MQLCTARHHVQLSPDSSPSIEKARGSRWNMINWCTQHSIKLSSHLYQTCRFIINLEANFRRKNVAPLSLIHQDGWKQTCSSSFPLWNDWACTCKEVSTAHNSKQKLPSLAQTTKGCLIRQAWRSGLPSCNKYKRGKMLFRINLQK